MSSVSLKNFPYVNFTADQEPEPEQFAHIFPMMCL